MSTIAPHNLRYAHTSHSGGRGEFMKLHFLAIEDREMEVTVVTGKFHTWPPRIHLSIYQLPKEPYSISKPSVRLFLQYAVSLHALMSTLECHPVNVACEPDLQLNFPCKLMILNTRAVLESLGGLKTALGVPFCIVSHAAPCYPSCCLTSSILR
jgi:hypothetical protein